MVYILYIYNTSPELIKYKTVVSSHFTQAVERDILHYKMMALTCSNSTLITVGRCSGVLCWQFHCENVLHFRLGLHLDLCSGLNGQAIF